MFDYIVNVWTDYFLIIVDGSFVVISNINKLTHHVRILFQARTKGGGHGGIPPPFFWFLLYEWGRRKEGCGQRGKEEKWRKKKEQRRKKKRKTRKKRGKQENKEWNRERKKRPNGAPTCKEEKNLDFAPPPKKKKKKQLDFAPHPHRRKKN